MTNKIKNSFVWLTTVLAASLLSVSCSQPDSDLLIPRPSQAKPVADVRPIDLSAVGAKVDLLFVVDDSGSMQDDQANLSRNIDLFLDSFFANQIIDYHVGVITSDPRFDSRTQKHGRLQGSPRWIEPSTPDKKAKLKRNILVGTNGYGTEAFFSPVKAAISGESKDFNQGFYRDDAYLVLVYLTDAETQDSPEVSPQEFKNYLVDLKGGDAKKIIVYGAYVPPTPRRCRSDSAEPTAFKLDEFFTITNAVSFELCDPDFGKRLAELGDDLKSRIDVFIPLDEFPRVETIEVTYGNFKIPQSLEAGWSYSAERVGLVIASGLDIPDQPAGTQLEISYIPINLEQRGIGKRVK